jgi:hypothetical protein
MTDELHTQVALMRQGLEQLQRDFYSHHNEEVADRRRSDEDRKLSATERMAVQVTLANVTSTLAEINRRLERADRMEPRVVALELEHARSKGALYIVSSGLSVLTAIVTAWVVNLFKH